MRKKSVNYLRIFAFTQRAYTTSFLERFPSEKQNEIIMKSLDAQIHTIMTL